MIMMIGRYGKMSNDVSQVLSQPPSPLRLSQHLFTVSWIEVILKIQPSTESSERGLKLLLTASSKSPKKGGRRGMAKLL